MGDWTKKQKDRFLTTLVTVIKDPTTLVRKQANELKVHERTVRTAIKQDLKLKLFARTPRLFFEYEDEWKKAYEVKKNKKKKHKNLARKFFLYFGLYLWSPSSPDLNSLDYAIWGVSENKSIVISKHGFA